MQNDKWEQHHNHHNARLKEHSDKRKMQIQVQKYEEKNECRRLKRAPQEFHFHPQVNINDPRYQIFIGLLVMNSCILQSNAYTQKQPLSMTNSKSYDHTNNNLPSQLPVYTNNTCSKDLSIQEYTRLNGQFLESPWDCPLFATSSDISQQKPVYSVSANTTPLKEKELLSKVKSQATKTRNLTYSKLYPNHLQKTKTKKIYESFCLFLPQLRAAIDQTMTKEKKLGLILEETHMDQGCDLFNQLVISFVKIYLKDIQTLYSEGNKELIDMLKNEAKTWQANNKPFRPIKNNEGKAWEIGKIAYFENLGISVKHTEAPNLDSHYMSNDVNYGLIEACLCVLDAPAEYCKKKTNLRSTLTIIVLLMLKSIIDL